MKIKRDIIGEFLIIIDMHQRLALNSYIFAVVMDELTKLDSRESNLVYAPLFFFFLLKSHLVYELCKWYIYIYIYIVLVDETRSKVNVKLEIWWDILEFEGCWFNRTKTKYMECKFDKSKKENKRVVRLDG